MLTIYNKNVSFDRSNQNMFFDSLGYGVLTDLLSDPLITEELNGSFILEFEYKKDGKLSEYLVEENIIKAKGQPFSIYSINKNTTDRISVLARHWVLNEWDKDFLVDVAPTNLTANNALLWLQQRSVNSPNIVISGNCETVASARYVRKTMLEAIFKEDNALLKRFGGELSYATNNVYIGTRRGSASGLTIRQGKNLSGAEYYLDFTTVTTRLLPVGKDGLTLPNLFVDSPLIGNYATPIIRKVEVDTEDVNELESFCNELYDNGIDKPTVSIKIDFIELSKTIEYQNYSNLEAAHLGDTVNVYIPDLNLNVSTRIVKTVYNDNLNRITAMELGSIMPNIVTSNADIQTKISQLENSKATILDEAKETASELIKHPFAGYIYIDDTTGSLYIMDTNDINTAQNVWKWGLGGLGFSSTGINGTYGIAITQDGRIVADYILTGTLSADRIEGYNQLLLVVSSHDDQIREITTPTSISSGSSISLDDSAETELIDFELEGKTTQETRSGKNLLIIPDGTYMSGANEITAVVKDGVFSLSGTTTANRFITISFDYTFEAIAYTFSKNNEVANANITVRFDSGILSQSCSNINAKKTETFTESTTISNFVIKIASGTTLDNFVIKPQLEKGTESTSWEQGGVQPSPEFPSELVSVGYTNLFNVDNILVGTILDDGDIQINSQNANFYTINYKENTSYVISGYFKTNGSGNVRLRIRYTDGTNDDSSLNPSNSLDYVYKEVVTPANKTISTIGVIYGSAGFLYIKGNTLQITKGAEIHSYIPYGKYGIEINNINKNLFTGLSKGIRLSSTNGSAYDDTNGAASDFIHVDFITNSNYTISGMTNNLTNFISAYNLNKEFLGRTGGTRATTLTVNQSSFVNGTAQGTGNIAYLRVTQYKTSADSGTIDDVDNLNLQLEVGNTNTEYIEHKQNKRIFILNEPLRAIRNVKDRLYIQNGILYVERKIESTILNGTENTWAVVNTGTANFFYRLRYLQNVGVKGEGYYKSNQFGFYAISSSNTGEGMYITSSNELRLRFGTEMTLADFKNWLSTHNTEVQYILAEPYTEEIGQVDIPSTYKGITHINTTDELEPNMNITYVRDTALGNYVEEQFNSAKTIEERHYAELKISDSEIIANVNATLTNYSTTTEMNAAITLKADEINQVVSTKVGNDEVISKINQSSESITINANKLNLQGYITATDLSTSGSTIINGSNITTGTIDASTVSVTNINANNITGGTINGTDVTITNLNASNITSGTLSADKLSGGTLSSSSISVGGSSYYLKMGTSWTKHPEVSGLNVTGGGGININNLGFNSDGSKFTFAGGVQSAYFYVTNGLTINSGATLTCYGNVATNQIKPGGYLQIATGGRTGYGTNSGSIYMYASAHITLNAAYDHYVYIGNANVGNTRAAVDGSGPSSRCLKTNISEFTKSEYTEALQLLDDIKLYDYKYKYNIHPKENQYGFIIDDLLDNKLADKFLYFRDEKAGINENNYLDYSVVEDNPNELPLINFKRYDEETLIKYLLVVCKALQYKIDKLESEV